MKKKWNVNKGILLAALLCLLFLGNFLVSASGPKIKFKEESWDFGAVKQGVVLNHVFSFQNTGDSPLLLKNVRTSCGCTAALVSEKNVAPGNKGEIKVTFSTKGYGGKVSKEVYVDSNDPTQPRKQLSIMASIKVPPSPKIQLDNYSSDLGLVLVTEEIIVKSKIKNAGELELEVDFYNRNASFTKEGKKISSPIKIPSKKDVEIEIKIPARDKKGLLREYILMKSNDPMRPSVSLNLTGYVVTKEQVRDFIGKHKEVLD
ncbi:DUF1573 domain-containing protein [Acidobacteriota bacterium]